MEKKISQSDILKLIALYRDEECLWNVNSKSYKLLHIKAKAIRKIANILGCDENCAKKKFKYLRAAYTAEKKKIENSKKSGSGTDEIYKSNLFYFDEISFLDQVIVFRNSVSNAPKADQLTPEINIEEMESEALTDNTQDFLNSHIEEVNYNKI